MPAGRRSGPSGSSGRRRSASSRRTPALAPLNPGVRPWDELSPNEQQFAARLQEAFAAQLDHTDAQIGRLVAFLKEIDQLDDTLLIVMSDNGASQEGGPTGVFDEMRWFNGMAEDVDQAVKRLDDIGGPESHSNIPWGWSQVGNTPLKWYKQNTHAGGVRDPLIVHWPGALKEEGTIRRSFCHAIDIMPTILELTGTEAPKEFRGVEQMPLHGASLAPTLASADAKPGRSVQYFEMLGHRGIWQDGWKAVVRHVQGTSWDDDDKWELYHLDEDFSETNDLAEEQPERLRAMVELWWQEAEKHGVLPLDDRAPCGADVPRRETAGAADGTGRVRVLPTRLPHRLRCLPLGGARLDDRGGTRAPGLRRRRRAGQSRHDQLGIRPSTSRAAGCTSTTTASTRTRRWRRRTRSTAASMWWRLRSSACRSDGLPCNFWLTARSWRKARSPACSECCRAPAWTWDAPSPRSTATTTRRSLTPARSGR